MLVGSLALVGPLEVPGLVALRQGQSLGWLVGPLVEPGLVALRRGRSLGRLVGALVEPGLVALRRGQSLGWHLVSPLVGPLVVPGLMAFWVGPLVVPGPVALSLARCLSLGRHLVSPRWIVAGLLAGCSRLMLQVLRCRIRYSGGWPGQLYTPS